MICRADLSGCVCVFFFKVALVDVGLCRWWLVSVVAAVVVGGYCNLVVDVPVLLMVMTGGYIILM